MTCQCNISEPTFYIFPFRGAPTFFYESAKGGRHEFLEPLTNVISDTSIAFVECAIYNETGESVEVKIDAELSPPPTGAQTSELTLTLLGGTWPVTVGGTTVHFSGSSSAPLRRYTWNGSSFSPALPSEPTPCSQLKFINAAGSDLDIHASPHVDADGVLKFEVERPPPSTWIELNLDASDNGGDGDPTFKISTVATDGCDCGTSKNNNENVSRRSA